MKSKRQIDDDLDEGYRQMAMDEAREAEALEWTEGMMFFEAEETEDKASPKS